MLETHFSSPLFQMVNTLLLQTLIIVPLLGLMTKSGPSALLHALERCLACLSGRGCGQEAPQKSLWTVCGYGFSISGSLETAAVRKQYCDKIGSQE